MVIQLTKTKSITIGGGGGSSGGAKKKNHTSDVVGIDMFGGDSRGFPAVRLALKKGQTKVVASGFLPDLGKPLPKSWVEAAKNPVWTLPPAFQAPHAAFSINSDDAFMVQTTQKAVTEDILNGSHQGDEPNSAAKAHKLGLRHDAKKPAEDNGAENQEVAAPKVNADDIKPGVPISNGGIRFVMRPMALSDDFVMEAGMPEYQALWLSRLLPEGRRPTVASIQPHAAAITASILKDPGFLQANGTGLALFINDNDCTIAGYKDSDLVLWRRCQNAPGGKDIRDRLRKGLGVDDEMLDGIMSDNLIDPRPILEPIVVPIVDELAVSRDYLASKLNLTINTAFVVGLSSGLGYWNAIFDERAKIKLAECKPFAGLEGSLPEPKDLRTFTGALGAALAFMAEGEA